LRERRTMIIQVDETGTLDGFFSILAHHPACGGDFS
jgi:hypothetical protein